jgi:hypothetical protein
MENSTKNKKLTKNKKTKKCTENKKIKKVKNNIVRFFINDIINDTINKIIGKDLKHRILGLYYGNIHTAIMFLGISIILFCNNIFYLIALLIIISLDAFTIVILHDCPLTMLEKKHLGTSIVELKKKFFKSIGILYDCNHAYEYQLELVINVASATIFKILVLIFIKIFSISLSK